jgi:hypothetical protein
MNHTITKQLVKAILKSPFDLEWSLQGLGMLRTYLSPEVRLHIWDERYAVPNVSPIHDHPWHLESYIVCGLLMQRRYTLIDPGKRIKNDPYAYEFLSMAQIKCGENACTTTRPLKVLVRVGPLESYTEGETYKQTKDEIHESSPVTGTVTLVSRTFTPDREHARVFWRGQSGWVDAAPRPATRNEITEITQLALLKWFSGNPLKISTPEPEQKAA